MNNDFDLAIVQVDSIQKLAAMLLKTPHYKVMGEAGVYSILFAAKAVGIDPFQALNGGFYFARGKVGMSTELMALLIRRAGHSIEKDPKSDDTFCSLKGKRKDTGDEWVQTFTLKDAERAALLGQDTYKKYPAIMLYNRAMSALARQLFPDVIKGYGYCPDEIDEITKDKDDTSKNKEVIDVKIIENQQDSKPKLASKEDVDALISLIEKCPKNVQDNFHKIVMEEFGQKYFMTALYCDRSTKHAQSILKDMPNVT